MWGASNSARFDASKESMHVLSRSNPWGDKFQILGMNFDVKLLMCDAIHSCATSAIHRPPPHRSVLRSAILCRSVADHLSWRRCRLLFESCVQARLQALMGSQQSSGKRCCDQRLLQLHGWSISAI